MQIIRHFFSKHWLVTTLLVVMALGMKMVVPTGYMIGQNAKILTIEMCDDSLGQHSVRQIAIPMKQTPGQGTDVNKGACPYASLSIAFTGGAAPDLLALAFLFILALGFAPIVVPQAKQISFLRPPLRGPPFAR